MNEITPFDARTSPFDALRREDERGDFWSARELMPELDYSRWQRFTDPIERARISLSVNGQDADAHVEFLTGAGRKGAPEDYRLTREGAYAVVQNCDIRKDAVAAAHGYFRDRTMRFEEADARLQKVLSDRGAVVRLAREVVALDEMLQVRTEELKVAAERMAIEAPKVQIYEAVMNTHEWYSLAEVAQMLKVQGKGRQTMINALRDSGVFCVAVEGEGPRPRQEFLKAGQGLFDVRLIPRPSNRRIKDSVTFVSPAGVEFIHDRLLKMGFEIRG